MTITLDKDALVKTIRAATEDETNGKPSGNIIEHGCAAARYHDPQEAANMFIGGIADAILSAAPTPPAQGMAEGFSGHGEYTPITIRSGTDTPPIADHAEPVAWRWRWLQGNTQWHVISQLPDLSGAPVEKEPLYATPPVADHAGMVEALKAAHEYVVDGLAAQDQRRRDVEGYPSLMKSEQDRLEEVRADLRLVEATLSAAPKAAEQAGMVVKPLAWEPKTGFCTATGLGIHYAMGEEAPGFFRLVHPFHTEPMPKAQVQATAQADFERRILSALSAPQPVERDAIRAQVIAKCAKVLETMAVDDEATANRYDHAGDFCMSDIWKGRANGLKEGALAILALGKEGE